jgi:hypothetical protein
MNLHPFLTKKVLQQGLTNALAMTGEDKERFHQRCTR